MQKPEQSEQNDLSREELEREYTEPEPTPRNSRLMQLRLNAIDVFREHQLVPPSTMPLMYAGRSRWLMRHVVTQARRARIARRGDVAKYTGPKHVEIACMMCGALYVGGDLEPIIFGGGEDGNELLRLAWIGRNWDVGGHVHTCALTGMRDKGKLSSDYDEAIARHEVDLVIQHCRITRQPMRPWEELLALDPFYSYRSLIRVALACGCINHTALPDWGQIVSWRVLLAWAAVRRLCILTGM